MQKQIYGLQKGGAQPHVYGKDLSRIYVSMPILCKADRVFQDAKQADKSEYYN